MKTIIAGSRPPKDKRMPAAIPRYVQVGVDALHRITKEPITEVVCGGAIGVDNMGREWAKAKGIPVKMMRANWQPKDMNGATDPNAGWKRNQKMAQYADACIAIWDGKSNGTKSMIGYAKQFGLALVIVNFGGGVLDVMTQRAKIKIPEIV